MLGRKVKFISGTEENGFLPMPELLSGESSIIYLCSPNNPTGAVYNHEQLKQWVDYAIKTGSLIIYDSAYEAFINGDYPHSIYAIEGSRACAVEISSLSKTAGFTGTRCSWTIVPKDINIGTLSLKQMWDRRQSTKFNGVPYIIQKAAEAALSDEGIAQCRDMVKYYMNNASLISGLLKTKNIKFTGGTSSPYIWFKCPNNMDSWEFFDYLLTGCQVVGTPGAGFGKMGEGWFRLTSFSSEQSTKEAVSRLEKVL
jgi:LL-diaminopimelate aminotransferase